MKISQSVNQFICQDRLGVVNLNFSNFFEFGTVTATRGQAYKLYKSCCTSSIRGRYFAERTVNVCNFFTIQCKFFYVGRFQTFYIVPVDFSSFMKCNTD